jgi:hypothetical protein
VNLLCDADWANQQDSQVVYLFNWLAIPVETRETDQGVFKIQADQWENSIRDRETNDVQFSCLYTWFATEMAASQVANGLSELRTKVSKAKWLKAKAG